MNAIYCHIPLNILKLCFVRQLVTWKWNVRGLALMCQDQSPVRWGLTALCYGRSPWVHSAPCTARGLQCRRRGLSLCMWTGPSYCYPSGWFLSQPRVVSFHAHDQCSAEYLNTQRTLWSPLKVSLGSSLLSWNLSSFVSLASPFWLLSSGYQPPCGLPCSRCSLSLSAGAVVGLTSLAPFLSGIAVLCCIVASLLKTIVSYFACFGVLLDEGGLTIAASILCDRHCRNTLKYCRNTLVNHHTK